MGSGVFRPAGVEVHHREVDPRDRIARELFDGREVLPLRIVEATAVLVCQAEIETGSREIGVELNGSLEGRGRLLELACFALEDSEVVEGLGESWIDLGGATVSLPRRAPSLRPPRR